MKTILITGSHGFIATNFIKKYSSDYHFIPLSHKKQNGYYTFDELETNLDIIKTIDVILNFAGANIGTKRWSESRKKELLSSRIDTSHKIVELFNKQNHKPHLISASAVGIYDPKIPSDEDSIIDYQHYANFSQEITKKWESEVLQYKGLHTITRFGVVFSSKGGAFPKMLAPFLYGFGGRMGNGQQYFPWIALPDLLQSLHWIIENSKDGIYNLVAPHMVNNEMIAKQISKIWRMPSWLHMPEFVIKLIFGQMGEELFLNSLQVRSNYLPTEQLKFSYPDLEKCLIAIRNKKI